MNEELRSILVEFTKAKLELEKRVGPMVAALNIYDETLREQRVKYATAAVAEVITDMEIAVRRLAEFARNMQ